MSNKKGYQVRQKYKIYCKGCILEYKNLDILLFFISKIIKYHRFLIIKNESLFSKCWVKQ